MKPLKTKVSLTLDSDLVEYLKDAAEEDDRSFSQYVNRLLRDGIAREGTDGTPPSRKHR